MASIGAFSEQGDDGSSGSGSGAPTTATYITQTPDGTLSAEQALGALATGILFSTTTTGVVSILTVGSGLTLTASTLTNNLITGLAGGQTAIGGTAASETLSLQGTTNGTAGKVISIDPFVIPSANSLTNTALQINGDPNTGLAQKNGADTLSVVCGGAESIQVSSTAAVLVSSTVTVTNGVMTLKDTTMIPVGTGTGTKIATATTQKLGFWNVTPVIQPATTGTTTGFTANASANTLFNESTFSGGVGTKLYTISDVVLALKQAGIMAPS